MRGKINAAIWCVLIMCFFMGTYCNAEDGEEGAEAPKPKGYRIQSEQPDGRNGYYRKIPSVLIQSEDDYYKVKYIVEKEGQVRAEGEVEPTGEVLLGENVLEEGEQKLTVWVSGCEEKWEAKFRQEKIYKIDTKVPRVSLVSPAGFDTWYTGPVTMGASAEDENGGQIEEIRCYIDGQLKARGKSELTYKAEERSAGGKGIAVRIEASDRAGNTGVVKAELFIDSSPPLLEIEGISDYEICSTKRQAVFRVREENILKNKTVKIEREEEGGSTSEVPAGEWTQEDGGFALTQTFPEDGIYRAEIQAKDEAGHTAERKIQIIVDKGNPVITWMEQIEGKVLKEFSWDYNPEDLVKDFTSYIYEIKLDGRTYARGEKVIQEGAHTLYIWARDAAGNESEKTAGFLIDRTPPEIQIDGGEDGKMYEKPVDLQIRLKDENDWFEEIKINGDTQKLNMASQVYRFSCEKSGDYTVEVKARDIAGNIAAKSVAFRISKPESVISGTLAPVKELAYTAGNKAAKLVGQNRGRIFLVLAAGIGAAAAVTAAAIVLIKRKNSHKREDAKR